MQANDLNSNPSDMDVVNDQSPLAWVLDELRKSLDGSIKALKRFVRDAEVAKGSDLATLDASQLRIARQQLHQAVGALEMVGLSGPALVLRAMETAVQKFVQQPEQCSQTTAVKIEYASFALTEYLEGILADKPVSALSLFPQYRQVKELVKADRIHPADLWSMEWRWLEPELNAKHAPGSNEVESRIAFDQFMLQIMRGEAPQAAAGLKGLSLGFSARQTDRQPRIFWKIAAAYFEALEHGLLPSDIYVRRASSRVLLQYASLSKGDIGISDRLAHDLLFFCAQASASTSPTPTLSAVQAVYGLARFKPVDYEAVVFGRFDPAMLVQARKRIVSAKEAWSALSAGDANKLKVIGDQFSLVTDSLVKLHPPSEPLAQVLTRVIDATARSGHVPSIELAMEVATSVLYLEAAFDDLDPSDVQLAARTRHLAERLEIVKNSGIAQPLEPWMEALYRRVSDKQTMGSVVGELRVSIGELEKSLDIFFRNPKEKSILARVPGQLAQMRGVLSVLGLDQASHAVMRMRDSVEQMIETEFDEERTPAIGAFDQLGNNLGALSFLIDMLNYQPALAKKLFVYDDVKGELRPLMGRTEKKSNAALANEAPGPTLSQQVTSLMQDAGAGVYDDALGFKLDTLATHAALAGQPVLAQVAHDASIAVSVHDTQVTATALNTLANAVASEVANPASQVEEVDFEEDDLRDIFLEEAREVTTNGLEAIRLLGSNPSDTHQMSILRRVFHTLKGSSRMVGLHEFGEGAWAMEQLLNGWLADQKSASHDLLSLSGDSLAGFSHWIEDIAANSDSAWTAAAFRISAHAIRTEGKLIPLVIPQAKPVVPHISALDASTAALASEPEVTFVVAHEVIALELAKSPHDVDIEFDFSALDDAPTQAGGHPAPLSAALLAAKPDVFNIEGIDLDSLSELSGVQEAANVVVGTATAELLAVETLQKQSDVFEAQLLADEANPVATLPDSVDVVEMSAADFEAQFLTEPVSPKLQEELATPQTGGKTITSFEIPDLEIEAPIALQQVAALVVESTALDVPEKNSAIDNEQIKVIGDLRIGIPLYNVYLNEADEWSRRLLAEVSEWAMECSLPVRDSVVFFAHSLAGSSATVGFNSLSDMARALEGALQLSQAHYSAAAAVQYADLFVNAAEDIRRLLHQFAAGFLKDSDQILLSQLRALEFPETEVDLDAVVDIGLVDLGFAMDSTPAQAAEVFSPRLSVEKDARIVQMMPVEIIAKLPVEQLRQQTVVPPATAQVATLSALPVHAASAPNRASVLSVLSDDIDGDEDDEIDAVDAVDTELFPIFDEEAIELMPQLGGALRQWSARPDNIGARTEILRGLHTLKGSARLVGALRLGEMAHKMESEIEFLGADALSVKDFEPLLHRFDVMQHTLDALRKADAAHETLAGSVVASTTIANSDSAEMSTTVMSDAVPDTQNETEAAPPAVVGKSLIPAPQTMAMQPLRQAATASIRVRSQLLDRMVNQAGEVMITRSRLEVELNQLRGSLGDMNDNLNRLRQHLRDIELQAETQMQSRLAQAKELQAGFDPLEFDRFTRVQELTRMMAESVNDVATVQRTLQRTVEATEDDLVAQARQTRELQRDLLKTRMVEFEGISDRLYRVVRLASKETGKQVKLDLLGGTIEMDRGMLDRMTPAFEHLLRNCVAHGIESPAVRSAAGKDAAGLITVELRQDGNDVSVEFRDDGAGLDLARIREKAISSGLISADQSIDDQQAANLIFMPGFTTAVQVTELSGRGIGMDVVLSEVNGVGGRIETSSIFGQGTQFKLVLPLTTAVTQVVMIRSGSLAVGVPANVVETVRRTSANDLQQAYNTGSLDFDGEAVPFFWSGALLQASSHSSEVQAKNTAVVVFRSAAQRVALHVDEVLGTQEVVVKNLGPQLSRLPGLAGMSVLASGAVVLIYNPVALASVYGLQARALSGDRAEPPRLEASGDGATSVPMMPAATPQIPLIMVVDDSITVRRVTQRLLQREGYRVVLAADGLQALERLQEERPALVLSDIEMPRMDGFDLVRNIRADAQLKDLPIVMITSRIAEKHREHAKELGVDHYLGKPYAEEELMSLVRHYCGLEAVV